MSEFRRVRSPPRFDTLAVSVIGMPYRILLVEDNPADVFLFEQAFQNAHLDCKLNVIENGAEAIEFLRQTQPAQTPDLIVLDLHVSGLDGLRVLEAVRSDPRLLHMPVAVTSSATAPDEQARAEQLGVQAFLTKPPTLEGFLEIGSLLKDLLAAVKSR